MPQLSAYGPYTSKDLDYFGHIRAAEKLAQAIGGTVRRPGFDHATPQTAVVSATIEGYEVEIDFLNSVLGVRDDALIRSVVDLKFAVRTADGPGELVIPVMHPLHCLQSRVANVIGLGRRDDTSRRQLNAAPIVLREYLDETLAAGATREVTKSLRILFDYLRQDIGGRDAHLHMKNDPLEVLRAFMNDERLDPRWRNLTLTPMTTRIERAREVRVARQAKRRGPAMPTTTDGARAEAVDDETLKRHLAPPGSGAGFAATRAGGIAYVAPLTPRAEAWLRCRIGEEATWAGDALAVEMRYFPDLADAIIAAGFLFERDALPN